MLCRNSIGNFCKAVELEEIDSRIYCTEYKFGNESEWAFTVYVTFCGDYPNCFWKTYSREKGGYIPSEFGDTVTVELVWYGSYGNCAADYLGLLKRQAGEMTAWLEGGFI